MWPGQVSNPGPLTFESGALPTALVQRVKCWPAALVAPDYARLWKKSSNINRIPLHAAFHCHPPNDLI